MADKDRTKILDAARGALEIANYGLKLLSDKDEAKVTAGLSNVAVFGRIVTSRLQLLRSADHHFDEWYAPHQEEMAADPLCRYFYELRTAIEHQIPPEPTHYGTHIEYLDMRDLTPLWAAAPPGARSLFIGDSQGRNGFEVELPDEERMVDQFVVTRRAPRARAGLRHAGHHSPGIFRLHGHRRGKVERASLGIQEKVRPVEEQEILTCPALRIVEGVRLVMEFHGDGPAVVGDDAPGVRRGLVPRERLAARGRAEPRDVAGKPTDLVVARCPDREREEHGLLAGRGERHRDVDAALDALEGLEGDGVADVGDRCGARGGGAGLGAHEERNERDGGKCRANASTLSLARG